MGDVANILGIQSKAALSTAETAQAILAGSTSAAPAKKKPKKPKGMSREVYDLMGPDGLVPAMETSQKVHSGFKDKRISATKGKWIWAPFKSSARSDGLVGYHWQKADVQYNDYPYAKFNVRSETLVPLYTDDEYSALLQSNQWTRSETDHLMYTVFKYDLRWPVIADRYDCSPPRSAEEMQHRYLTVLTKMKAHRSNLAVHPNMDVGMSIQFEKSRRLQAEMTARRTADEEGELQSLKEELKAVEAVLRKHKKLPKEHAPAKNNVDQDKKINTSAPTGGKSSSRPKTPRVGSRAVIAPGRPSLQSIRLNIPEQPNTLSTTLLKKMISLLRDLGVPERPMATRAVCDGMDTVRKLAITLCSLHSAINKKEKELVVERAIALKLPSGRAGTIDAVGKENKTAGAGAGAGAGVGAPAGAGAGAPVGASAGVHASSAATPRRGLAVTSAVAAAGAAAIKSEPVDTGSATGAAIHGSAPSVKRKADEIGDTMIAKRPRRGR
eukprot:GSChrysophyteH1.ASY1.ANO1.995.1 assembled CDS